MVTRRINDEYVYIYTDRKCNGNGEWNINRMYSNRQCINKYYGETQTNSSSELGVDLFRTKCNDNSDRRYKLYMDRSFNRQPSKYRSINIESKLYGNRNG